MPTATTPINSPSADQVDAALAKLSKQQRDILCHFWRLYIDQREREASPGFPGGCRIADTFGVPYRSSGEASFRASLSRAVARLENRGLVLRQNARSGSPGFGRCREHADDPKPIRTTNVSLTALGKAAAKRLTT